MKIVREIDIHHVSRVEGHGNIRIRIRNGKVAEAKWEIVETPRFFEALLVGKLWDNVPWICGRICGICSVGHTLAAIRAVENAFRIVPSAQTSKLRLLLKHMETLQSHILHLYFLALPDFLGVPSVLPLASSHPDAVRRALSLKKLANDACDIIGGRRLHPTRTVVGGFTMLPSKAELQSLRTRLSASMEELRATEKMLKGLDIPRFERETEFVSLHSAREYPFIGGELVSSDGVRRKESEYLTMTNEYAVPHSTAKWARLSRSSFSVGALARFNNNFRRLHPEAAEAAAELGLVPVCHNPFMNNVAQLVECIHVVRDSLDILDFLLGAEWEEPRQPVTPRAGKGVAAVEVPRGILYHAYEFDGKGKVVRCDCVIPTGQNHGNIQEDLKELARLFSSSGRTDQEIEKLSEMLVRSYDPCISCSVH